MTQLQEKLEALFRFIADLPNHPPRPYDVVIAEPSGDQTDPLGRPVLVSADFHSVEQYEERFSALMALGFAWINLNFYGLIDGRALVIVELPDRESGAHGATAVNFSGPTQAVSSSSWDARPHIVLM